MHLEWRGQLGGNPKDNYGWQGTGLGRGVGVFREELEVRGRKRGIQGSMAQFEHL